MKILWENVPPHKYFVFLNSEGTDSHKKQLNTTKALISALRQTTNTSEVWTNMDYRRNQVKTQVKGSAAFLLK